MNISLSSSKKGQRSDVGFRRAKKRNGVLQKSKKKLLTKKKYMLLIDGRFHWNSGKIKR